MRFVIFQYENSPRNAEHLAGCRSCQPRAVFGWHQAQCPICHLLQNLQRYAFNVILLTTRARLSAAACVGYLTFDSHERHLRLFL